MTTYYITIIRQIQQIMVRIKNYILYSLSTFTKYKEPKLKHNFFWYE